MKKIIIVLFIVFLTGCKTSNKFVGTWYHVDDNDIVILTFNGDNTCILEESDEEEKCTYKYDDKKIFISSKHDDLELNYNFIDNYLLIDDTRFYKDMKEAKDNKAEGKKTVIEGKIVLETILPDLIGLSLEDAERMLKREGLSFNVIKVENDFYEKDRVVQTNPLAGMKVNKSSVIDLFVSNSVDKVVIEDYTSKNYLEVKEKLETIYKMKVIIEKRETGNSEDNSNSIVGQSIAPGTEIEISIDNPTTIILYIPNSNDY